MFNLSFREALLDSAIGHIRVVSIFCVFAHYRMRNQPNSIPLIITPQLAVIICTSSSAIEFAHLVKQFFFSAAVCSGPKQYSGMKVSMVDEPSGACKHGHQKCTEGTLEKAKLSASEITALRFLQSSRPSIELRPLTLPNIPVGAPALTSNAHDAASSRAALFPAQSGAHEHCVIPFSTLLTTFSSPGRASMSQSPPVPLAESEPLYGGFSRFEVELEV